MITIIQTELHVHIEKKNETQNNKEKYRTIDARIAAPLPKLVFRNLTPKWTHEIQIRRDATVAPKDLRLNNYNS